MSTKDRVIQAGIDSGLIATNAAARYALPAGGVTLAGVGLYEIGQALLGTNQQTEGTVQMY